ncbi:GNAT family N-acetyltransferase [Aquibium microcysteis]|uniref:GNAT family N-acetyltransferase n=1 Tax=Aquibium microcysteis TaxID=675281 RepID=UPI001AED8F73|nr:GNAT family N-acetyltransferase [Aquibium microcysteis]
MGTAERLFPPPAGDVRELTATDLALFRDHLLRLSPASRHDRFNGFTDDAFLASYAARCFSGGAVVLAYVVDGVVRGAAELHDCRPGSHAAAEIAFSVEDGLQQRGVGATLFASLIARARAAGCRVLHVTTHAQNVAMKALARKFGATLCFASIDAAGVIDLSGALPPAAQIMVEALARPDLSAERGAAGLARR